MQLFPFKKNKKPDAKTRDHAAVPESDILDSILDDLETYVEEGWLTDTETTKILDHSAVESAAGNRKAGTLKKEVVVTCDTEEIQKEFEAIFNFGLIEQLLDIPYWGLGVFELNWYEKGGYFFPLLTERNPKDFTIQKGELLFLDNGIPTEIPPFKAAFVIYRKKHNKPLGTALLKKLLFPTKFSNSTLDLWLKFLKKYGVPWTIGKTDNDKNEMAREIFAMLSGDAAVIDPEDSIETISPEKTADFEKLTKYCDDKIREIILGGNLTTQVSGGSFAAASVHGGIREDIALSDKMLCRGIFKQTVQAFKELNNLDIELDVDLRDEDDPKTTLAERDTKIKDMVNILDKDYIETTYNVKLSKDTGKADQPDESKFQNSVKDKEGRFDLSSQPVDELDKAIHDIDTKAYETEILTKITGLMESCGSYQEAFDTLLDSYPDLDLPALETTLANHLTHTDLQGRAEVEYEQSLED